MEHCMAKRSTSLGLFAALALCAAPAFADGPERDPAKAPAGRYVMDPHHTSVIWRVSHLGVSMFTAQFTNVSGAFAYDPKAPLATKVDVRIDPASVSTKLPDFDKELASDKWFAAKKCGEIIFRSTKIEETAPGKGLMHGDLTFHCVTKPLTLDVTFNGGAWNLPDQAHDLGFSAVATLKRSQWGLDNVSAFVGDDVQLQIETEFLKEKK
jgi:polyisoprenoid-binding protein YceI